MTFTEKLDLLMEEKHLNKNSLSKACGIPYTTIDGWYKKGVSDLKLSTLRKLTNYFGLSLDYWLKDEEDAETKKSPAPEGTEDELSEEDMKFAADLRAVLAKHGVLGANGDITPRQEDIIFHTICLLRAAFKEGIEKR